MSKIQTLLDAIKDMVDDQGSTWKEKRAAIIIAAKEEELDGVLDEFLSWFEGGL